MSMEEIATFGTERPCENCRADELADFIDHRTYMRLLLLEQQTERSLQCLINSK